MSSRLSRLLFIALWIVVAAVPAFAAGTAVQNIVFNADGKDKLIIFTDKVKITAIEENDNNDCLTIKMTGTVPYTWTNEIGYSSKLIAKAALVDEAGKGCTLVINFKKPVSYRSAVLGKPQRTEITFTDMEYSSVKRQVADGVVFDVINYRNSSGKVRVYMLDIAPDAPYYLKAMTDGAIPGRTKLSVFARRTDILAAVNGSYFAPNGEIIGILKTDNLIVSSDSIKRAAAGFRADGKMEIEIAGYSGTATFAGRKISIDYVNRSRCENSLVMFNRAYGQRTGTNAFGTEYVIDNGVVTAVTAGNSVIPENGIVLSANGKAAEALKDLKCGDAVAVNQTLGKTLDECYDVIGAGPQLVRDGKIAITSKEEKILPDIAVGRAPRTAVAQTKNGHILLVVVDGRQPHSIGMSLRELSGFLLKHSAEKAMNFDGGGSSAMLVYGSVINLPSDGRERPVASAVVLVRK